MKNIGELMKKAQSVQSQVNILQTKLENQEFTGESAQGAVKITLTGKGAPKKVSISKEVVDKDDVETLEDLIFVAIQNAKQQADDALAEGMEKIQSSLGLPPNFKLPF